MKTTAYLDTHPGTRPRIFAHRGLTFQGDKSVADENTLQSFELALAAGADYLESDIQVTKDNVPVLFHDGDLTRLVGKKARISDLSFAQIEQIELPHLGKIPSLEETLVAFPEAKFNLDLKTPQAETVGIQTILKLNAENRVLVSSFSEASRKRALAISPTPLATSAGSSKVLLSYLLARAGMEKSLARQLVGIDALQIPIRLYGIDFTHPKFLEQILPLGVEVHFWTINDPQTMLDLFALGAHGIVTDRADLAVKTFS
jgi:glycerophosphoryl diester phosphodiesterase